MRTLCSWGSRALLAGICGLFLASTAQATTFYIDRFQVSKQTAG